MNQSLVVGLLRQNSQKIISIEDQLKELKQFISRIERTIIDMNLEHCAKTNTENTFTATQTFQSDVSILGNLGTTSISQLSDIRMKENIKQLSSDIIDDVKTYSFTMKNAKNNNKTHYGVIAQELQQLAPELIEENENQHYLSVNYIELIPMLIHRVQQQQQQINELKNMINESKSELEN